MCTAAVDAHEPLTEDRIAVATCAGWPAAEARDKPLADALARRGCAPVRVVWNDRSVDWSRYAACIVRSTWDWQHTPERFRGWLHHAAASTRLFNDLAIMLWGLDKRYLHSLAESGVPVVPSVAVQPDERDAIPRIARERGWRRVVVKPSLGATAYRSALVDVEGPDPHAWSRQNADFDGVALVQPFMQSILARGEVSLVFIDGRFTHAVSKHAAPGDYRVQREFGGRAGLIEPEDADRRLAEDTVRAVPRPSVYARIDVVRDDQDRPRVIECEVIEPELYFEMFPPSADALAAAVLGRLGAR